MNTLPIIKMSAPSQSRAGRSLIFSILVLSVTMILLSKMVAGTTLAALAAPVSVSGGGSPEQGDIFDATVVKGTIEIKFTPNSIPDTLAIYYPPRKKGGKQIYTTGGPVNTPIDTNINNPLVAVATFKSNGTLFEIVINEGGTEFINTVWSYTGEVKDSKGKTVLTMTVNQETSGALPPPPTPPPTPPKTTGFQKISLRSSYGDITGYFNPSSPQSPPRNTGTDKMDRIILRDKSARIGNGGL